MKLTAYNIYLDYCRIKKDVPSYRLGQHYCNVIGIENTIIKGLDLFTIPNEETADTYFYELCDDNCWDVTDLPVFGDYDLTTIRPF